MMRFTPRTNLMLNRLLWKESRELAPLWAGVLGIGLLVLLLAMRVELGGAAHGAAAVALAGCFGLAAVARQFAGEDEDGTIAWLRMLPCDGSSVWWAKLITAYAGSLLLWLPLAGMALITARQVPNTLIWEIPATANIALATFLLTGPAIGMAVSLESRNVLTTVLGTAGISLVVSWIAGLLPDSLLYGPYQFVIVATSLGAARRLFDTWWQGPAAPVFEELLPERVRVQTRAGTVPRLRARLWAWSEQSATRRMWRSLLWQDLRGAGTFLFWWLLIVPAAMGGLKFVAAELRPAWWLILSTPLLAGVWSLRRDQRFGAVAFFGDRGISALAVWLSRQAVWVPLAVGLGMAGTFLDAVVFAKLDSSNLTNVSVFSWWTMWGNVSGEYQYFSYNASLRPMLIEQGLVFLSLYAAGHLAGLVFPPLVLALVMGSLLGGTTMLWQGWRMMDLLTPTVWGLFLPVGLLAITAGLTGPWVERRLGIKRIVASVCLLVAGWIGLSYAVALSGLLAIPVASKRAYAEIELARKQLLNPDTEATREIVGAVDALWSLRGDADKRNDEFVRVMAKHLANKPTPQLDYALLKERGRFEGLGLIPVHLELSIRENAESMRPETAAELLLAYERLRRLTLVNSAALLGGSGSVNLWADNLPEAWMAWAVRKDVSAELLAQMIDRLEGEMFPPPRARPRTDSPTALAVAALLIENRTPEGRRFREALHRIADIPIHATPPGIDGWRLRRALVEGYARGMDRDDIINYALRDLRTQISFHGRTEFTRWGSSFGTWNDQPSPVRMELSRFGSVPGSPSLWFDGTSVYAWLPTVSAHNRRRLLLTALAVEHFRKTQGRLPERLDEIKFSPRDQWALGTPPVDLFTGAPFGYEPRGFKVPAITNNQRFAARQPLLWMAGAKGLHWAPFAEEPPKTHPWISHALLQLGFDWHLRPVMKAMRFDPQNDGQVAFGQPPGEPKDVPFSPWARPIFSGM